MRVWSCRNWSAGLDFDLPLDRKLERNAYRAALIRQEQAARTRTEAEDTIKLQIREDWRAMEQAKRSYENSKLGVKLAERRVEEQNLLASVTERTREIGIRRALGAKRCDIIVQFLVETVLLSGVGGVIGVAAGVTIPYFVTVFAHMKTIVTFWSPSVAFTISAAVGVVFGVYPALRGPHEPGGSAAA